MAEPTASSVPCMVSLLAPALTAPQSTRAPPHPPRSIVESPRLPPPDQGSGTDAMRTEEHTMMETRQSGWKQGNFQGEDISQRQPSPQTLTPPPPPSSTPHEQPELNHVEDETSQSPWDTPFKVKVNFKGTAMDATLDTGASLSAVRADLVPEKKHPKSNFNQYMVSLAPPA